MVPFRKANGRIPRRRGEDAALGLVLRQGVGRARRHDRASLVLEDVGPFVQDAAVVDGAGRGEHVPAHALRLAEPRERHRRERVHLVVGARVVLRGRVVGQTAHVDDGVHALQHPRRHAAHVRLDQLGPPAHGPEAGVAEVEAVEHAHGVAALEQLFGEDGADVPAPPTTRTRRTPSAP